MLSLQHSDILISKAKKSTCRYKVSAIGFDRRGNFVGCTSNHKRFGHYGGSVDAEIKMIRKYGKKVKTMIICRVNNKGNLLKIDACDRCQKILDKLGIKVLSLG